MKIFAISKTLIAPLILAGSVASSSCTKTEYISSEQKAKELAMPYLSAQEYLLAERQASRQPYNKYAITSTNQAISYWDSIATENAVKKAYSAGQQMVKDSIAGKPYTKPEYKIPIDTIISFWDIRLKDNAMFESAKYYNAEEFEILRQQEPVQNVNDIYASNELHYWNLITRAGAERKAFNDGAEAERAKL